MEETKKKERWKVCVISLEAWCKRTQFFNPVIDWAVVNKTMCHTDKQRNYFKKIE